MIIYLELTDDGTYSVRDDCFRYMHRYAPQIGWKLDNQYDRRSLYFHELTGARFAIQNAGSVTMLDFGGCTLPNFGEDK